MWISFCCCIRMQLKGVSAQIQELKNAPSSYSIFSSLKDTSSSLSHLDLAHIASKNPA